MNEKKEIETFLKEFGTPIVIRDEQTITMEIIGYKNPGFACLRIIGEIKRITENNYPIIKILRVNSNEFFYVITKLE